MRRFMFILVVVSFAVTPAARPADDDDPEFRKRKLSEWIQLLHGKDSSTKQRRGALLVMSIYGAKIRGVLPAISTTLRKDEEVELRKSAAQLLGQMGEDAEPAVKALAEALQLDESDQVRATAARALGKIGAKAKSTVNALAAGVKDQSSPEVRRASIEALGLINANPDAVLASVLLALKDNDTKVRYEAVLTLHKLGPKSAALEVPNLGKLVEKDKAASVRAKSAEILYALGGDARAAAPNLIKALSDSDVNTRRWAVLALGKLPAEDVKPGLKELARVLNSDSDPFVRGHAVQSIAVLGKDAVPALAICVEKEPMVEVRLLAIRELGKMGPKAADGLGALKKASGDGRAILRNAALEALKKVKGE